MSQLLIKNGRVVTAVDDYHADIFCLDGRIAQIGIDLVVGDNVEVVDAKGKLVLPGGVDVHTHMENTFGEATTADTYESGTKAAAFGGTTTIVDFAAQNKGERLPEALDRTLERAEPQVGIDFGLHMITTEVNDQTLADMKNLIRNDGVTSFKMFMAYPGDVMVDDASIFRAMRLVGQHGGMVTLHAENGMVIDQLIREALEAGHTAPKYHELTRPALMEGEATHRGIKLAELAEAPVYFVHLSCRESLKCVVEARDLRVPVFAETCPHYLFLDRSLYADESFNVAKYVMTPPLREKEDQEHLWQALKFDDLQVISTDHCPFCFREGHLGLQNQKSRGKNNFSKIPNGAPGVETRMSIVFDGGVHGQRMSLNRFVQLTATAPSKIFGLFPQKGTIAVGSDADIVLFDPDEEFTITASTHHSRADYTLFEGRKIRGRVKKVWSRGTKVVDGDEWLGRPGHGCFVKRGQVGGF